MKYSKESYIIVFCDRNEKLLPDDVNVTAINVFERCDKKFQLDTITDNEDNNFDIKNKKA